MDNNNKGKQHRPLSKAEKLYNRDRKSVKLSVSRTKALKRYEVQQRLAAGEDIINPGVHTQVALNCPASPVQTTLNEVLVNPAYPSFKVRMSQRNGTAFAEDRNGYNLLMDDLATNDDEDFEYGIGSAWRTEPRYNDKKKKMSKKKTKKGKDCTDALNDALNSDDDDGDGYGSEPSDNLPISNMISPRKKLRVLSAAKKSTSTTVTPTSTKKKASNCSSSSRFCNFCAAVLEECPECLFGRHSYLRVKALIIEDEENPNTTSSGLSITDINEAYFASYQFAHEYWNVRRYDELPICEADAYNVLPPCMAAVSYADSMKCFQSYITAQTNNEIENKKASSENENENGTYEEEV